MLFSVLPFVMATPIVTPPNPQEVFFGETIIADFVTDEENPNLEMGGLISQIIHTIRTVIMNGGETIWEDEDTTNTQNFDIYAFPAGSEVNLLDLTVGSEYETSLSTTVRGVTDSWITYNVDSVVTEAGGDYQTITLEGQTMEFIGGDLVQIIEVRPSPTQTFIDIKVNGGTQENRAVTACNSKPGRCPTLIQMQDNFGVTVIDEEYIGGSVAGTLNTHLYCFLADSSLTWKCLGNLDESANIDINTYTWDFTAPIVTSGYMVSSSGTQSLALLPVGNHDVYAVL